MARTYEVAVGADGKQFNKALKQDVIKPVEDAAKSLDELGDEGDQSGRKLEAALRDASRASDKLDRSVKDTSKGVDDLKGEANQTGREMAASFKEPADALDAVQELAANAFQGFGPAGAVAGLAAATGIGLVTSEIIRQQEEAEKMRERLTSAYADAAEEGRKYLDQAQITADVHDLMFNPDRASEWKQIQADALRLELDRGTLYAANAGDLDAQRIVNERIRDLMKEQVDAQKANAEGAVAVDPELQKIVSRWDAVLDATNKAKQGTEEYSAYVAASEAANREQIDKTARVAGERYAELAAQYGAGITVPVRADLSQFEASVKAAMRRSYETTIAVRGGGRFME
ncbi:hypothetical protein GCM10009775_32860 [Microbacterium aoyamense]|uniref:Uncharacterized protein n=1 Tax=Microbacterium aoyamense TaxID=344166 RepID=A0ABN2PZ15_9MICO|nr:hypothetical protein [Microbacterium aoyamense]